MSTTTLRIPDELDPALRSQAEATGLSLNAFVVEAVREKLAAQHRENVLETARAIITRDAETLDRLGRA